MSDTIDSDLKLAAQVKLIARKSENLYASEYFDEQMVSLGYNRRDISKVIEKGTFAGFQAEIGSDTDFRFCIAYKFRGHVEACHVRGWIDLRKEDIDLTDIFNNSRITN